MEHSAQSDYSKLEKELTKALKKTGDQKIQDIRDLMAEMAESSHQRVIFTSYPACNSEG